MSDIADVEANELNALESLKDVTVYVFDTCLFNIRLPDTTVQSSFLLLRRPDWGGLILELMKYENAYLYWGE